MDTIGSIKPKQKVRKSKRGPSLPNVIIQVIVIETQSAATYSRCKPIISVIWSRNSVSPSRRRRRHRRRRRDEARVPSDEK